MIRIDIRFINRLVRVGLIVLVSIALQACGKFMPPAVPEAVTPDLVASLQASTTKQAVILTWSSPTKDRRDKELKNLDGYRVERKQIISAADLDAATFALPQAPGFNLIGEISDTSVSNLESLRETAKAEGKTARRLKAESGLTNFHFEDSNVKLGDQFLYRVIPINEYGLGRVKRLARVVFRGLGSDITYPEPEVVDEDLSFNPF